MNLKLALGIGLPSALILILIILSTSNIGFNKYTETVEGIKPSALYVWDRDDTRNITAVQTITMENNFGLSRKYEIPMVILCLYDKDGIKEIETLQPKYSEGIYLENSDIPIFNDATYGYRNSRQTIDLPSYSKKQIKILVGPKYLSNYKEDIDTYNKEYDELLLFETTSQARYAYNSCRTLNSEEINSAIHIPILN